MNKPRKHHTAAEKMAILRRHLVEPLPVSDSASAAYSVPVSRRGWTD